jgi:Ca2+-binding RTX toxin-like protein
MRRILVLLTAMAVTLVVASGVALAVNKIGTNGPDTLRGTNGDDNLLGRGGNDRLFSLDGDDNLLGGKGKDVVVSGTRRHSESARGDKNLKGGPGNDIVFGGLGTDSVLGEEGNDLMLDGPTREFSQDKLTAGAGNDAIAIDNIPASEDVLTCGRGFDWVSVDREDVVAPDCERVFTSFDRWLESIPPSFFEGLPPFF